MGKIIHQPIKNNQTLREKTPLKVGEGLQVKLWANDSLAPDPIAMSIADDGAVFW